LSKQSAINARKREKQTFNKNYSGNFEGIHSMNNTDRINRINSIPHADSTELTKDTEEQTKQDDAISILEQFLKEAEKSLPPKDTSDHGEETERPHSSEKTHTIT
jgi:hypothetical protein